MPRRAGEPVISQPLDVQRQPRAIRTIIWVVSSRGRLTRDPEFMGKLVAAGAEVEFCDLLLRLPPVLSGGEWSPGCWVTRARGFGAELGAAPETSRIQGGGIDGRREPAEPRVEWDQSGASLREFESDTGVGSSGLPEAGLRFTAV
jgi:hypothetical protein